MNAERLSMVKKALNCSFVQSRAGRKGESGQAFELRATGVTLAFSPWKRISQPERRPRPHVPP